MNIISLITQALAWLSQIELAALAQPASTPQMATSTAPARSQTQPAPQKTQSFTQSQQPSTSSELPASTSTAQATSTALVPVTPLSVLLNKSATQQSTP